MNYKIPVLWRSSVLIDVEANSLDEACDRAEDIFLSLDLAASLKPEYVEGSFQLDKNCNYMYELKQEEKDRNEYERLKKKFDK